MKLTELAKILDKKLEILFPDVNGLWYCHFTYCEVKEGSMLSSPSGRGKTPAEALAKYADLIVGERLVFNASGSNRIEFIVPNTLDREVV